MYFELPLQSQAIHYGSLAQLVQSVCLTSRGSGVRIPQLPPNESSRLQQCKRLFHEREHSSVGLERLLDKQEVCGSNPHVPTNENQTVAEMQLSFFLCYSRVFQRFSAVWLNRKSNRETTWRQLFVFCAASQKCCKRSLSVDDLVVNALVVDGEAVLENGNTKQKRWQRRCTERDPVSYVIRDA